MGQSQSADTLVEEPVISRRERTTIRKSTPKFVLSEDQIQRRKRIAGEICETEKKYVQSLETMIKFYLEPLRDSGKTGKPLISQNDLKIVFSIIEVIKNFHQTFLIEISACYGQWSAESCVGDIFLKNLEFFKFYSTYVNGFNDAMVAVSANSQKNSKFAEFLEQGAASPDTGYLDLMSFLIMPVQRLPRYVMLLADLQKHTPPGHPGHAALTQALERVKSAADFVNEAKRKAENAQQVLNIQNSLTQIKRLPFPLVQPHRHFVVEGELAYHPPALAKSSSLMSIVKAPSAASMKKSSSTMDSITTSPSSHSIASPSSPTPPDSPSLGKNRSPMMHYFLFNDCILLTIEDKSFMNNLKKEASKKWKVKAVSMLAQVEVTDLPDTSVLKNAFEVFVSDHSDAGATGGGSTRSPDLKKKGSYVLSTENQAEKVEWIKQLYWLRYKALPRKEVAEEHNNEEAKRKKEEEDKNKKSAEKKQKKKIEKENVPKGEENSQKKKGMEPKQPATPKNAQAKKGNPKKDEKKPLIEEKKNGGGFCCFGARK